MSKTSFLQIIFALLLISTTISSQIRNELHSISGTIIDQNSGEPIPYVNVYLDATTLGTSTNNNGFYKISSIPKGSYKIIVSAIGFEKIDKNILLKDSLNISKDFRLQQVVYKLNEVNVIAEKDYEWANSFNLFKREFLGTSEFAKKCKILNPEALVFSNTKNAKLEVKASVPIELNNYALGYKIYFEIKDFTLLKNREFNYIGNIRFIELKAESESQKDEWEENRENNYKGSFRHFLISLNRNKLMENGFQIFNVNEPNWNNLRRRNFLSPKVPEIVKSVSDMEKDLEFFSHLMVVYDDWEEEGFLKYRNKMGSNIFKTIKFQTSWLYLPFSSATFDINGNLVDDYTSVKLFGYWAWQRVANLLPNNYMGNYLEE